MTTDFQRGPICLPGRRGRIRVLGLLAVLIFALVVASQASAAYIYWADPGEHAISRANLDGTGVIRKFIKHVQFPCGLAIQGGYIYWANLWNAGQNGPGTTIGRASLNGTGVDNSFITGADWPCGVTIDGSSIYWADGATQNPGTQPDEDGTIGRANLDGTGVTPAVVDANTSAFNDGLGDPVVLEAALASSGSQLFWGDWGNDTVGQANVDGSNSNDDLITLATGTAPEGLAVTGGQVYWAGSGSNSAEIGRANLDGSQVDQSFLSPSQGGICGLTTDGTSLYWTWVNDLSLNGGVARVGLNGQGLNQFLTGHKIGVGCGIAVGGQSSSTPPPPGVRITKATIHQGQREAVFSFRSVGKAAGFQCALRKGTVNSGFSRCRSPRSYKKLALTGYTFLVRAFGPGGTGPATRRKFTI